MNDTNESERRGIEYGPFTIMPFVALKGHKILGGIILIEVQGNGST